MEQPRGELQKLSLRNMRTGQRFDIIKTEISSKDLEKTKKELIHPLKQNGNFIGKCYICNSIFNIPSEWESLSENGCCKYCFHFLKGDLKERIENRDPTIEEILKLEPPLIGIERSIAVKTISKKLGGIKKRLLELLL